ncbi:MAG: hypothetical protein Q8M05_04410 [Rhodoferax sp.]|uniref:DUF2231 domain-containing protein n=1 Tax=Rhodoferax sp. TaxID=50421 RepID=UPI0027308C25|nr:DUF2231 domain-containing protein [Rhodoferax sp.]MDP1528604.1 hypothetical protein [Rhodoferax sp.]
MGRHKFLPVWLVLAMALALGAPVFAHEKHDREAAARAEAVAAANALPVSEMTAPHGPAAKEPALDHHAAMGAPGPKTTQQRLLRWLGAMHPAAVHFPIALFLVAAVLEIAALTLRRPVLTQGTRVIIVLAALSALVAAALGWLAMGLPGKDDLIHGSHRWIGTSIAGLGLLAWWAKERWVRKPGRGRELIYVGVLTVVAGAILFNAALGAALTHGMDHLRF